MSSRLRNAALSAVAAVFLFQQAAVADHYSINLLYKQVSVESISGKAVFKNASLTSDPGRPEMPYYNVQILLPPDADFGSVQVRLVNPSYQDIDGTYIIDPPQFFNPPKYPDSTKIVEGKDTTIYRKDAFYPADFKGSMHCDMLWHYKLVSVVVYPYLYNPVGKTLRKLTGGVLDVSFQVTGSGVSDPPIARAERELRDMIANPEVFETYGIASPPGSPLPEPPRKNYAIITTNAIYNGVKTPAIPDDDIDDYMVHLADEEGYTVTLVTESATEGPNT